MLTMNRFTFAFAFAAVIACGACAETTTTTTTGPTSPSGEPAPMTSACATMLCAPDTVCQSQADGTGKCVAKHSDPIDAKTCAPTGCSGTVCADEPVVTTCQYREEFACYKSAACERGADGKCGWKQTPELTACLEGKKK